MLYEIVVHLPDDSGRRDDKSHKLGARQGLRYLVQCSPLTEKQAKILEMLKLRMLSMIAQMKKKENTSVRMWSD